MNARRQRFEAALRKVVPSTALISRGWRGRLLDAPDRFFFALYPDLRGLPPNRFRVRVGTRNRIFRNHVRFLLFSYEEWLTLQALGLVGSDSRVVDIGSGCGRLALPLLRWPAFTGTYTGIDADREMVEWCRRRFQDPRFDFHHADVYSSVYNPGGTTEPYTIGLADGSQDLVMSQSLFSHLLEEQLTHYAEQARRVLAGDGAMMMTVFCREHVDLGGRWTFQHRYGRAFVQDPRYPEAAVAYPEQVLLEIAGAVGFASAKVERGQWSQSRLICRR